MTENPGNRPPQYGGSDGAPQYGQNQQPLDDGRAPQQYDQPQYGAPGQAPVAPGPAPKTVRTGVMLAYAAIGLSLVASLVSDVLEQKYAQIAGAIVGAAVGAMFVWFASRGKNWARIVVLVLAIIDMIGAVLGIVGLAALSAMSPGELQDAVGADFSGSMGLLWALFAVSLVCSVLYLVGAIFLWRRPSSEWYRAHKMAQYR